MDEIILTSRGTGKSWLRILAQSYKEELMLMEKKMGTQKNNTPECHERGLQKRIENYNTQQTLRTMTYGPIATEKKRRHIFFVNALVMLGLAEYV